MGTREKNILILECDQGVATTVCGMAEGLGHRTCVCDTTDGALTELSRKHYDVVIANHLLKHASVSLPWLIRSVQPDARIVVTSTWRMAADAAATADCLLHKPFGMAELGLAIDAAQ